MHPPVHPALARPDWFPRMPCVVPPRSRWHSPLRPAPPATLVSEAEAVHEARTAKAGARPPAVCALGPD
eukprot:12214338-Alexandrium_andersonii.AAC.1